MQLPGEGPPEGQAAEGASCGRRCAPPGGSCTGQQYLDRAAITGDAQAGLRTTRGPFYQTAARPPEKRPRSGPSWDSRSLSALPGRK